MAMEDKIYVVGVGMTKFEKPDTRDWDFPDMAEESATKALADAGIPYDACSRPPSVTSTASRRPVSEPSTNSGSREFPCSTSTTTARPDRVRSSPPARQLVRGGVADCVLALGFEKMSKGSIPITVDGRAAPMERHFAAMGEFHR